MVQVQRGTSDKVTEYIPGTYYYLIGGRAPGAERDQSETRQYGGVKKKSTSTTKNKSNDRGGCCCKPPSSPETGDTGTVVAFPHAEMSASAACCAWVTAYCTLCSRLGRGVRSNVFALVPALLLRFRLSTLRGLQQGCSHA